MNLELFTSVRILHASILLASKGLTFMFYSRLQVMSDHRSRRTSIITFVPKLRLALRSENKTLDTLKCPYVIYNDHLIYAAARLVTFIVYSIPEW